MHRMQSTSNHKVKHTYNRKRNPIRIAFFFLSFKQGNDFFKKCFLVPVFPEQMF